MCGPLDGNVVNYSTLANSCRNALNNCFTADCVRDDVSNAFYGGRYKFCPNRMNLYVTSGSWAAWAYGLEYFSGNTFDCIAYCTP